MDAAALLSATRRDARLSQTDLAARAGTSQATISAYENGSKQPSVATLSRLLAAAGWRLTVEPMRRPLIEPSPARLARAGRTLVEVLGLAAALPVRHGPALRFPRLPEPLGQRP